MHSYLKYHLNDIETHNIIIVLGRYALNKRTEFTITNLLLILSLISSCIVGVFVNWFANLDNKAELW